MKRFISFALCFVLVISLSVIDRGLCVQYRSRCRIDQPKV